MLSIGHQILDKRMIQQLTRGSGEPLENDDDFDFYENFKDLKIRSVTYEGLGDATDIGE